MWGGVASGIEMLKRERVIEYAGSVRQGCVMFPKASSSKLELLGMLEYTRE